MRMEGDDLQGAAATALFQRIYTLSGVTMSAVDADDTISGLTARLEGNVTDSIWFLNEEATHA